MRSIVALVIVLVLAVGSFAGPFTLFRVSNQSGADKTDMVSQYALQDPLPVFDSVITPPASFDLPKEITLAEEPAKDCFADKVIWRSWIPKILLRSGF